MAPVNATPAYLRNPVTLNGGAIAATGYEVSFGTNPTRIPQGSAHQHAGDRAVRRRLHRRLRHHVKGLDL